MMKWQLIFLVIPTGSSYHERIYMQISLHKMGMDVFYSWKELNHGAMEIVPDYGDYLAYLLQSPYGSR